MCEPYSLRVNTPLSNVSISEPLPPRFKFTRPPPQPPSLNPPPTNHHRRHPPRLPPPFFSSSSSLHFYLLCFPATTQTPRHPAVVAGAPSTNHHLSPHFPHLISISPILFEGRTGETPVSQRSAIEHLRRFCLGAPPLLRL
ncbi:hypothetical protein S245_063586 [Arachis hypogaea]